MNELPKKIKEEITKVCHQIEASSTLEHTVMIEMTEQKLIDHGYAYPQWVKLMLNWKQRNVILTSEEYFRKNAHSYSEKHLYILKREIDALHSVIGEEAYRQALYVIASQILDGSDFDDGLAFEWHCRTGDVGINNDGGVAVLVALLKREISFWQPGLKAGSLNLAQAEALLASNKSMIDISRAKEIEARERAWERGRQNLINASRPYVEKVS